MPEFQQLLDVDLDITFRMTFLPKQRTREDARKSDQQYKRITKTLQVSYAANLNLLLVLFIERRTMHEGKKNVIRARNHEREKMGRMLTREGAGAKHWHRLKFKVSKHIYMSKLQHITPATHQSVHKWLHVEASAGNRTRGISESEGTRAAQTNTHTSVNMIDLVPLLCIDLSLCQF